MKITDMIAELMEIVGDGPLTEWEEEFLYHADDLTAAGTDLTDAEEYKLREVYDERVLGGEERTR